MQQARLHAVELHTLSVINKENLQLKLYNMQAVLHLEVYTHLGEPLEACLSITGEDRLLNQVFPHLQ